MFLPGYPGFCCAGSPAFGEVQPEEPRGSILLLIRTSSGHRRSRKQKKIVQRSWSGAHLGKGLSSLALPLRKLGEHGREEEGAVLLPLLESQVPYLTQNILLSLCPWSCHPEGHLLVSDGVHSTFGSHPCLPFLDSGSCF